MWGDELCPYVLAGCGAFIVGRYMNIESHSLINALTTPAAALKTWLDVADLPAPAVVPTTYDASLEGRVIVPTARLSLFKSLNDTFSVRALILSDANCDGSAGATVNVAARPLGSKDAFKSFPLHQLTPGRCVFTGPAAALSAAAPFDADFEWYAAVLYCHLLARNAHSHIT